MSQIRVVIEHSLLREFSAEIRINCRDGPSFLCTNGIQRWHYFVGIADDGGKETVNLMHPTLTYHLQPRLPSTKEAPHGAARDGRV